MTIIIPLNRGYSTLVDDDESDLTALSWHVHMRSDNPYVRYSHREGEVIHHFTLHRVILERMVARPLLRAEFVDHINGDTLNNCRSNLRLATNAENVRNAPQRVNNKSGYKGVCWHKATKKWMAQIGVNYQNRILGYFDDPAEAHEAYCKAARELHGEFANFGDTP